ncbi:hypothetical protein EBU24_00350 [bacterium]|nr:hypothetical protein [bacterium]
MKNIKIKIDNEIFYVFYTEECNLKKDITKLDWGQLLYHLKDSIFPKQEDVDEETDNNHIIDLSLFLDDFKFLVFTHSVANKRVFSVYCNQKIISKKKLSFGKWSAKLECGHSYIMDEKIDDLNKFKRIFCSKCLEESNG